MHRIGLLAGSGLMYGAMTELGIAQESGYSGPPKLSKPPKGTSVIILGAGIAGMVAAVELRDAGYDVKVLEYNARPGGRNWSLYGGDTYAELGGNIQHVRFDKGQYFNPGPWRIPHHHYGIIHYCKRLKVELEPFTQVNYNAYVHSAGHFGGRPVRYREMQADYQGGVAELLAKATQSSEFRASLSKEDQQKLLEALRTWGALDKNFRYVLGRESSSRRGPRIDAGGGLKSLPEYSRPANLKDILSSEFWRAISWNQDYFYQTPMFQPKGGMGRIGAAFGLELGSAIQYNAKVTDIRQDPNGVSITYVDAKTGKDVRVTKASWCICTIPASILSQIPMNVGGPMRTAISQLPYRASLKVGLQFKRRFWEEDEAIYGGLTYTDQPNALIGYPSSDHFSSGKGVLLGAYVMDEPAYAAAAKTPEERIEHAVSLGQKIHKQYRKEFDCGVAVAWHRVPWTLGCSAIWSDEKREQHYNNLCAIDGRIVLAGEHASRIPDWQEGSVTSATDAVLRLHSKALAA